MKKNVLLSIVLLLMTPILTFASEADLKVPELSSAQNSLLMYGFLVCFLGLLFGFYQYNKVKNLKAHQSMLDVSQIIFGIIALY